MPRQTRLTVARFLLVACGTILNIEERLLPEQCRDTFYDTTSAFGHHALVSSIASFPHELLRDFLDADKQQGQMRVSLGNFPRCLKTIHIGHAEVHDHEIRRELLNFLDSLKTVAGFPAELPIRLPFNQSSH